MEAFMALIGDTPPPEVPGRLENNTLIEFESYADIAAIFTHSFDITDIRVLFCL